MACTGEKDETACMKHWGAVYKSARSSPHVLPRSRPLHPNRSFPRPRWAAHEQTSRPVSPPRRSSLDLAVAATWRTLLPDRPRRADGIGLFQSGGRGDLIDRACAHSPLAGPAAGNRRGTIRGLSEWAQALKRSSGRAARPLSLSSPLGYPSNCLPSPQLPEDFLQYAVPRAKLPSFDTGREGSERSQEGARYPEVSAAGEGRP
ncbi:hypothetical protein C6P46_007035 [Rhodotorula mucilaginosa]|uniref:Uncharacterized protein n=1 Tax=Rhodotorula mucilaginosa TaxID=5537 RepID=A0A9P6VW19_RHOMI|nr:hypothetical protein C6P46_007035 [Rhodotorula mucilaginosa]